MSNAARAAAAKEAAAQVAAAQAAAEAAAEQARQRARAGVFALLVDSWLLVVGIATAVAPPAPNWLRVLGVLAGLVATAQLMADAHHRWPATLTRSGSRRNRSTPTATLLATRNPELAAGVKDALALLAGPVGQLVDADVVTRTKAAFTDGVHRADELYQEEIDLRSTLATLADGLHASGHGLDDDAQYQAQRTDLTRLQAQRNQADDALSTAASTLSTSLADAAFGRQRRTTGAQVSVARRHALRSDSAPDLVLARGDGALTALTDAVDGVRGRLDAIRELNAMTDRIAPDAAEAEVDR